MGKGTEEIVVRKKNKIIVYASEEYSLHVIGKKLLRLKNTGNGWKVKFYSFHPTMPHRSLNLDYDELACLITASEGLHEDEL